MRIVRVRGVLLVGLLLSTPVISVMSALQANAAQITTRSLTLLTGPNGTTGGSTPGGVVNHKFQFTLPTSQTLGSIKFEYCTIARQDPCVTPTGLNASAATFGNETGSSITGFTLGGTTANSVTLNHTTTGSFSGEVIVQINNVTNPTTPNQTFYVRITSYTAQNGGGTATDDGSVAASTARQIEISGIMPESLIFCTAEAIAINATSLLPDCSTAIDGTIAFSKLFSTTETVYATSQMAASTNAMHGYTITVAGTTLMNGSTPIPNITTAKTPSIGVSEFGMNLAENTDSVTLATVGGPITPISNATDFRAQALAGYATANTYKYASGDAVADSGQGNPGPGPTNGQRYTATYMVNVAGNQLAGTYSTTLTYVCTPTF